MNEPQNPYAAPTSPPSAFGLIDVGQGIRPAGQGARFANFVIDYFAQSAVGFVVGIAIVAIGGDQGAAFLEGIPGIVIGIPILVGYYFILEATTGRTLGKLITGTKVVSHDGRAPTIGQIAGRSFCRLIPFEAFSFFGKPTRGWHDSIPKTFVVKAR